MLEEPKLFAIDWQRDYDVLSIELMPHTGECVALWVMRTHSNRFTNGSTTVPIGYWELETIGM